MSEDKTKLEEGKAPEELKQDPIQEEQEHELTPTEQRALAAGWRPKEEWDGDPDEWKDAKTFVRDGEIFQTLEAIKRENKALKKSLTTVKGHYEKVREVEYARAISALNAQKKEALIEGDADRVIELDDKLVEAREGLREAKNAPVEDFPEPEQNIEFQRWVGRNPWYASNPELRDFADATGLAHVRSNPGKSPTEVLRYIEERVMKAYPDIFRNQRKNTPSPVEGGRSPKSGNGSATKSPKIVLSDEETKVMKRLVRDGVLTEEQYMKDLVALEQEGKR